MMLAALQRVEVKNIGHIQNLYNLALSREIVPGNNTHLLYVN